MTWLTLAQIAESLQADLHAVSLETAQQLNIERIERDSRTTQAGDLFIALKGERFDAHEFVPQIAGKASAALVSHTLDVGNPQVLVPDVRWFRALASMA